MDEAAALGRRKSHRPQEMPDRDKEGGRFALEIAQRGGRSLNTKPLSGFGGAMVLEIVADERGSTYRSVYTVRFANAVYVLHVFKKKSKSGIRTPQAEIALVRSRLKDAEEHHKEHYET